MFVNMLFQLRLLYLYPISRNHWH